MQPFDPQSPSNGCQVSGRYGAFVGVALCGHPNVEPNWGGHGGPPLQFLINCSAPMRTRIITLLLLFLVAGVATAQKKVPTPAEVFGFTPGDDRKLASWDQVVDYFKQLDGASDRVVFEPLGNTTMGKPFVVATISSPANLARLEEFKKIQDQLADPRKLGPLGGRDRKAAE